MWPLGSASHYSPCRGSIQILVMMNESWPQLSRLVQFTNLYIVFLCVACLYVWHVSECFNVHTTQHVVHVYVGLPLSLYKCMFVYILFNVCFYVCRTISVPTKHLRGGVISSKLFVRNQGWFQANSSLGIVDIIAYVCLCIIAYVLCIVIHGCMPSILKGLPLGCAVV